MEIKISRDSAYIFDENDAVYDGEYTRVYSAIDKTFNRTVIIKQVDYSSFLPEERKYMMDEVMALSKAGDISTNIPMIFDYLDDKERSHLYIVMQKISGESLRDKYLFCNNMTFLRWMMSLCDVVFSLNERNVFHKDIKPENIIITKSNQFYLIDFNISKKRANRVEGTPSYRAPEMYHQDMTISRRQVDIFSIGVIMYEYYTKELPTEGIHYGERRFAPSKHSWDKFREPVEINPSVPKQINDIIKRCMEKLPEKRYRTANDLKRDIKALMRR